jgi:hypothetical protein
MRGALLLLLVGAGACASSDPLSPGWADFVRIDAGGNTTCGLDTEGRIFCWGRDHDTTAVPSPTEVAFGPLRFTEVAVGRDYACALSAGGDPLCWVGVSGVPFTLSGAPRLDHMVIGHFPCGVTAEGAIWCWNSSGTAPVEYGTAGAYTGLSVDQFACALNADGKARCFGAQFGPAVFPVHDSIAWEQIVAMTGWACGVPVGGSAACFTVNSSADIGAMTPVSTFVIADGTRWAKLAGEGNRLGLITDGGRAYNKTINQANPTPEGSIVDWNWIIAGVNHFCGEVTDGTLRCWWENGFGQLGDGSTTFRANAVLIGGGAP